MVEKHHLSTRPRLYYLDFLRAIAILYVVAVHHLDDYAGSIYQNRLDTVLIYSFLGLFMFISGYLLATNNPIKSKADLWDYVRHRFLRIYPLYVLALLLFMACSLISFKGVLLHISLLNVLFDKSVMTLWFVSILCVFYIIYPIVAYKYSIAKTVVIVVLFYSMVGVLRGRFGLIDERLLLYFPLFLLGIAAMKHGLVERWWSKFWVIACSAFVFATSITLYFSVPGFNRPLLVLLMASAIPLLVSVGKLVSSVVARKFYTNIAYSSFCMYLLHRVIFYLATNIYTPATNIHTAIYLTLLAVPVIYAASFYLQRYYDRARNHIQH